MPTDEFHLRRTAQYLQALMHELELMKGKRTIPQRTERIMKPTPGPRAPGNITAISLHAEIEKELQHWIGTLSNPEVPTPRSAHGILGWVTFHAYDIAQQDDAEAFQDDMARWCSSVEKAVGRGPTIAELAKKPEVWHTATTICYRLHRMGYGQVTPQHLSVWASRGNIKMEIRGNKPCYLLANVLEWVTREDES